MAKPMGRPKIKYPKDKAVLIRLSTAEHAILTERAHAEGKKLSRFVREKALS